MAYIQKKPYMSAAGIIEMYDTDETFLGIVLVEKQNAPMGLVLPWGFVDIGENFDPAVVREMKEDVSLDVEVIKLLGVYADPDKDPHFHTGIAVYICKAYGRPIAAQDAAEVFIHPLNNILLEKLVVEERVIVEDYLKGRS